MESELVDSGKTTEINFGETILENLESLAKTAIDEEGIFPTPSIVVRGNGNIEVYANASSPESFIHMAMELAKQQNVVEQIIAIDTYTGEEQGTTLDSCLILLHCKRGEKTKVGVMEYSWNSGNPITKQTTWDNTFWNGKYKNIADEFTKLMKNKVSEVGSYE